MGLRWGLLAAAALSAAACVWAGEGEHRLVLARWSDDASAPGLDALTSGAADAGFVPVEAGARDLPADRRHARWWRIAPQRRWSGSSPPVLAFYAPFNNRITVLAPPEYRPWRYGQRDPEVDSKRSRHAFAVHLPADWSPAAPVYVQVEPGRRFPMRIALQSESDFARQDVSYLRTMWALYSALGVVGAICLVFGLMLAVRDFLLLAGALCSTLLYLMLLSGEAYALPGGGWLAAAGVHAIWWAQALAFALFAEFSVSFLALGQRAPRLAKALHIAAAAFLALIAVSLLPRELISGFLPPFGSMLLLGTGLAMLIGAVAAARAGDRGAWFFLIAWTPMLALDMLRQLQLLGAGRVFPGNEYVQPLAAAIAGGLFSFGLADRLLAVRHERDAARREAQRDALTGLLNRAGIVDRLQRTCHRARETDASVAVLFMDLDRFKNINDAHGHHLGDACLKAASAVFERVIGRPDLLGRYGGEEFLAVLPAHDGRSAAEVAERIRRGVQDDCAVIDGTGIDLTISIGVAADSVATAPSVLIERADRAMYVTKREGRNQVCLDSA